MKINLIPKKIVTVLVYLNNKYQFKYKTMEFHNSTPDYTDEELKQLSQCC